MPPELPTWIYAAAGALGACIVSLAGAIAVMWRVQAKSASDLIARVRHLEDARVKEAKDNAQEYRTLTQQVTKAMGDTTQVLREVVSVLRSRPCTADRHQTPQPHNLPDDVPTNRLER